MIYTRWVYLNIIEHLSFFLFEFQYFLDDDVFVSIDFNSFRYVSAFSDNEFDLLLCWCSEDLSIEGVDDTFDGFVITVSCVIGTGWDGMRFILSGLLGGTWWFDSVEVLLIESSIVIDTMFPVIFLKC